MNAKTQERRNAKTRTQAWTWGLAGFSVLAFLRFSVAEQPSLDDLLDLAPTTPESTPPHADVPIDPQVARRLHGANPADVLEQALVEMDQVSQRLGRDLDAGVQTQRQQEEILAKLDHVIEAASQQQQQRSPSQGGGGGQGEPQGQESGSADNTGQGQQQGQNQGQGQAGQQQQGAGDGGRGASEAARSGDTTQPLDEQRSEWGNLPPRLRDQLLEGTREKFSPVYRDLTEQYYKRLAEEGR